MDIITYALCKKKDNEIIDMIESMEKLTVVISDSVPTVATAEPNKLYLVDTNHDGIYEEYILAEIGGVEQIVALGQVIDLTNYYTKTETNNAIKGYHQVISDTAYSNLPDATKKNGNVYYVYTETSPLDEDGVYITNSAGDTVFVKPNGNIYKNGLLYSDTFFMATKVSYDNTNSGLTATNVQSAIDELRANDVGRFEKDNQGNITGEIFNTYTGSHKNVASGVASHAEGCNAKASGDYSHAEGNTTKAFEQCSHAEGGFTTASGYCSHAEGSSTKASEQYSHAEGGSTIASGQYSHAEGGFTKASGHCSHAEGYFSTASGQYSHASGVDTQANQDNMTAIGKYNSPRTGDLFNIGNGASDNARSNILEANNTSVNVNGDITRNSVPMYPLVYNPQTESFSFAGLV